MSTLPKDSAVLRRFAALLAFLRSETAGGMILILSAILALVWANSSAGPSYRALLQFRLGPETVHVWVNDGLMAIFFLLVGLELRREMTRGELASLGRVAAPALAALGGMIVPAMIFSAFNYHDRFNMRGWAVPVATDIAFALAVLNLLGNRVPISLKVFLTALAIIDDLGAIIVIALFYTNDLDLRGLGAACVAVAALWAMARLGVRALWPYLAGGVVLWMLTFESGVHSTLSGVALAFVVPMERRGTEQVAPAIRLEHALGRWVAYGILPLFGLTNAGLRFDTLPAGAWRDSLAIGTALGLLLGKQIGVFATVVAAAKLRLARLPAGVTKAQLYGGAVLCGIGFTMSLFIGDLAFRQTPRGDEVKLAVFVGSLSSAVLGLAILAFVSRTPRGTARPAEAAELARAIPP
jgi:Na+:H+ antiporter, NhaA family